MNFMYDVQQRLTSFLARICRLAYKEWCRYRATDAVPDLSAYYIEDYFSLLPNYVPVPFYIEDYRSLYPNYVPSSQATQVRACVHTPPPLIPLAAPELRGRITSLRVERVTTVRTSNGEQRS
ncbi:hypothetical protein B5X24_HaOG209919 [Helicoverpa armigera]|uniref:Uncharacterized protein n=1 Tax=Helicoverpa armigera TaxID=29058 RepID=A0A2W1BIX1_HELAM|nr:hypothetical protein B5X24_HaOG209919 [Helicoverpa armigera]